MIWERNAQRALWSRFLAILAHIKTLKVRAIVTPAKRVLTVPTRLPMPVKRLTVLQATLVSQETWMLLYLAQEAHSEQVRQILLINVSHALQASIVLMKAWILPLPAHNTCTVRFRLVLAQSTRPSALMVSFVIQPLLVHRPHKLIAHMETTASRVSCKHATLDISAMMALQHLSQLMQSLELFVPRVITVQLALPRMISVTIPLPTTMPRLRAPCPAQSAHTTRMRVCNQTLSARLVHRVKPVSLQDWIIQAQAIVMQVSNALPLATYKPIQVTTRPKV